MWLDFYFEHFYLEFNILSIYNDKDDLENFETHKKIDTSYFVLLKTAQFL